MRGKRIAWFLFMIALGLGLGLLYGWVINPIQNVDASPDSLRSDYKTDYVLMVAEIYSMDHDLAGASRRLAALGSLPAASIVDEGVRTARELGYAQADLAQMEQLVQDLRSGPAPAETGGQP